MGQFRISTSLCTIHNWIFRGLKMFYLKLMAYTLQFKEILSLILLIVWIRGFESINIRLCSRVGHAVESVRLVLGSWYLEMSVRGLLVAGYRLCSVCDDHCTVP